MKYLIALDDGHGMETPGKRTPEFEDSSFMHENEFNRSVVNYLGKALKRCGFNILLVAAGDADVPLAKRTEAANAAKADIYISVHANAMTGAWGEAGGIETYVYPKAGATTRKLAELMHSYLMTGTAMRDRGVKTADFYVLRETHMPAVLCECGFMDNKREAVLLKSEQYRLECAEEICHAVCVYYNMAYVQSTEGLTPIAGTSQATKWQMQTYILDKNLNPQINCSLDELMGYYKSVCDAEGIRMDVAIAQMLHETDNLRFGGIVMAAMNNFAGLGALDGNNKGDAAYFDTPLDGVKAQIQHLKAYANNAKINTSLKDPRFNLITRGSAQFVEWLGQKENPTGAGWATDPEYGSKILAILAKILKEKNPEYPDENQINIILDGKTIRAGAVLIDGYNYVRLRQLLEPMGYKVNYDVDKDAVVAIK